ncbi:MAG: aminoglycoside phosphotransferase family protein [Firmicutes bacterium]|nr:aminoglycoside phosphotransferase family protein [Bacillota bacterium]
MAANENKKASNIRRELAKAELDKIIFFHFKTAEYSWELLNGGMFNTTYLVTLAQNRNVVLRVGPIRREMLLSFEDNPMEAGRHVYNRCRTAGIPVPEVLACDTTREMLDCDYMIAAYVPGAPLSALGLNNTQRQALHRETGAYACKMHEMTNDHFGRVADIVRGGGFARWSDCLLAELDDLVRKDKRTKVFRTRQLQLACSLFARHIALLDEITVPRLVHSDLWDGNLLADNGHIVAVLDGDRAIYGDTAFEIAGGWLDREAFFDGYGLAEPQDEASKTRRKLYELLFRLEDAYIMTVEYNKKKRGQAHKRNALRIMRELRRQS